MDQRRAEIEAKRQRLEEMRRKRGERAGAPAHWRSVAALVAHAPHRVRYTKATQTEGAGAGERGGEEEREGAGEGAQELVQELTRELAVAPAPAPAAEPSPVPSRSPSPHPRSPAPAPPQFTVSSTFDTEAASQFLENAFKIFERARSDLLVRYDQFTTRRDPEPVRLVETLRGTQTVRAIEWSPHHPMLLACAYGGANSILSPHGSCVLLWSLEFPGSPEYRLRAPTEITQIKFSSSPWLVYGAGYNGQVYIWDLRQGRSITSAMRSAATGSGHLMPVCALERAPGINHDLLLSLSVEGTLCVWPNDRLVEPQQKTVLTRGGTTSPISSTCMALWPGDHSTLLVGTLEGTIYTGRRIDSVGAKAGIAESPVYAGHTAPVTAIAYHPLRDDSRVFISSSLDWSVRVWTGPTSLEIQFEDAVTAVAWSPHAAACFACCYRNTLEVWNLALDTQEAVARYTLLDLVTSIAWDPYLRTRIVCGSNTEALVLDLSADVLEGVYEF